MGKAFRRAHRRPAEFLRLSDAPFTHPTLFRFLWAGLPLNPTVLSRAVYQAIE